ncbi:hypothetical protein MTR67_043349 [Solanum verrucosum]|uniref:Uncharacterized protein n=1 Tax=Solanum verrucosum TaxID=315347 RepID=A0AAF0URK0_SOLVR|nr:hypothetical protein MTR67_043349 [Solanum verrucosum]
METRKSKALDELMAIEQEIENRLPSQVEKENMIVLTMELQSIAKAEEVSWSQKSRCLWLKEIWNGGWLGNFILKELYPILFLIARDLDSTVAQNREVNQWNLLFRRNFNDWELGSLCELIGRLEGYNKNPQAPNIICWGRRQRNTRLNWVMPQTFREVICWATPCMTWESAESGKHFITTIINGSDLVPTFSTDYVLPTPISQNPPSMPNVLVAFRVLDGGLKEIITNLQMGCPKVGFLHHDIHENLHTDPKKDPRDSATTSHQTIQENQHNQLIHQGKVSGQGHSKHNDQHASEDSDVVSKFCQFHQISVMFGSGFEASVWSVYD